MPSLHKRVFLFLAGIPATLAYPSSLENKRLEKKQDLFAWADIGDSWSSGVSYNIFGQTDYDMNKDECLRVKHAYSVKVNNDLTWDPSGQGRNFSFQACSGARLSNMAKDPWQGYIQMERVGNPRLITMQAGGNNAGFYNVASSCLFHDRDMDYGPDYPDQGECLKAITDARNYINGGQLQEDIRITIQDIIDHPAVSGNPDFQLFVVGYGHFFAVDDDTTWCNDHSFVLPWRLQQRQKLLLDLRKDINALVEGVNTASYNAVMSFNNPKIGWIDVTKEGGVDAFAGGRFCEAGHSFFDQYFGDKVFLWNASPSGVIINNNGDITEREPTEDEFNKWYATGLYTDDPNEVPYGDLNTQVVSGGPSQGGGAGVALRPFHPKEIGHTNMASRIVARLQQVYGTAMPEPSTEPTPAARL